MQGYGYEEDDLNHRTRGILKVMQGYGYEEDDLNHRTRGILKVMHEARVRRMETDCKLSDDENS